MWTPRVSVSIGSAGFGWFISKTADGKTALVARGNEDWGHSAIMTWYPATHLLIVVVTNSGFTDDKPKSRIVASELAAAFGME